METFHLIKCSVLHNWIKTVIRMRGDHEYFAPKFVHLTQNDQVTCDMKNGFYQAYRCLHGTRLKVAFKTLKMAVHECMDLRV